MKDLWLFLRAFWWSWRNNKGGVVIHSREYVDDKQFMADLTAAMKDFERRLVA